MVLHVMVYNEWFLVQISWVRESGNSGQNPEKILIKALIWLICLMIEEEISSHFLLYFLLLLLEDFDLFIPLLSLTLLLIYQFISSNLKLIYILIIFFRNNFFPIEDKFLNKLRWYDNRNYAQISNKNNFRTIWVKEMTFFWNKD